MLIIATPIAALFLGLEFPTGSALPVPGLPEEPPGSTMMVFSAVPWTLAGGLLGPFAAAALGMLSGLLRGRVGYTQPFSILDLGFMAGIFAVVTGSDIVPSFFVY